MEEAERRIPVLGVDFQEKGAAALTAFQRRAEERGLPLSPTCEGVRLTTDMGWMLLRQSLHDPLLPLNVEGNAPGDGKKLLTLAGELLAELPGLDLSVLE